MSLKKRPLLGAHMSIAKGLSEALIEGSSIGCTTIQIFTKNNRRWDAKEPSPEVIDAFKKTQKSTGIDPVVAHASYLINLGSPDPELYKKSINGLIQELSFCEKMNIPYLVLHPGSYTNGTPEQALASISQGIQKALTAVPGSCMILLETMAGQGTVVGKNFSELHQIYAKIHDRSRVGICLDTCHIFAAGYEFNTKKLYDALWQEFDATLGLSLLKVIHLNDSLKPLKSYVDRHEHIGFGNVGITAFELLMNDERFFDIPKILETPKKNNDDDYKNMQNLIRLIAT